MNQISSKSDNFSLRYGDFTIFKMAGSIMGSLKRPCKTSYRSSIETTVVNCLVFEKIEFLCTDFGETDRRIDGQHRCVKAPSLSRATA